MPVVLHMWCWYFSEDACVLNMTTWYAPVCQLKLNWFFPTTCMDLREV